MGHREPARSCFNLLRHKGARTGGARSRRTFPNGKSLRTSGCCDRWRAVGVFRLAGLAKGLWRHDYASRPVQSRCCTRRAPFQNRSPLSEGLGISEPNIVSAGSCESAKRAYLRRE